MFFSLFQNLYLEHLMFLLPSKPLKEKYDEFETVELRYQLLDFQNRARTEPCVRPEKTRPISSCDWELWAWNTRREIQPLRIHWAEIASSAVYDPQLSTVLSTQHCFLCFQNCRKACTMDWGSPRWTKRAYQTDHENLRRRPVRPKLRYENNMRALPSPQRYTFSRREPVFVAFWRFSKPEHYVSCLCCSPERVQRDKAMGTQLRNVNKISHLALDGRERNCYEEGPCVCEFCGVRDDTSGWRLQR